MVPARNKGVNRKLDSKAKSLNLGKGGVFCPMKKPGSEKEKSGFFRFEEENGDAGKIKKIILVH